MVFLRVVFLAATFLGGRPRREDFEEDLVELRVEGFFFTVDCLRGVRFDAEADFGGRPRERFEEEDDFFEGDDFRVVFLTVVFLGGRPRREDFEEEDLVELRAKAFFEEVVFLRVVFLAATFLGGRPRREDLLDDFDEATFFEAEDFFDLTDKVFFFREVFFDGFEEELEEDGFGAP